MLFHVAFLTVMVFESKVSRSPFVFRKGKKVADWTFNVELKMRLLQLFRGMHLVVER